MALKRKLSYVQSSPCSCSWRSLPSHAVHLLRDPHAACCMHDATHTQVTKKFGKGGVKRELHKPYTLELIMAIYYAGMTFASVWYKLYLLGSYCWIMGWSFILISFGARVHRCSRGVRLLVGA